MIKIDDVEIKCRDGWVPIIERLLAELEASGIEVFGVVASELAGRLSVDYNAPSTTSFDDSVAIAKILVLAEMRSYFVCEKCGRPGEHRWNSIRWRITRCVEHMPRDFVDAPPKYSSMHRPWRSMVDGDYEYDPVADTLVRLFGRLGRRYSRLIHPDASVVLTPAAEDIVDRVLWQIDRMDEIERLGYRIDALWCDNKGHLVIEDNIYALPDTPRRDLMMALLAGADDRISRLPLKTTN